MPNPLEQVGVVNCVFIRSDFAHAVSGIENAVVKVYGPPALPGCVHSVLTVRRISAVYR